MLRVVNRAVLSQCWFHLILSPVYVRRDRIDARRYPLAVCVEAAWIYASTKVTKVIPENAMVAGQFLKQSLKLMSMSSDSIHDAVFLCAEKKEPHTCAID